MTELSVQQLEREIEVTRARLARNLRILRSPIAHEEFTEAIKQDAFAASDNVVGRTRLAAQDRIKDWIDALKARAADNPAAVLAIAAGIGWRMIRNPPIATALVGVGLFSLLRGNPPPRTGRSDEDYVVHAKERLREQASEVAADIGKQARAATAAVTHKVEQWSEQAQAPVRGGSAEAGIRTEHWSEEARAALRDGSEQVRAAARDRSAQAGAALRDGRARVAEASAAAAAATSDRLDAAWQQTADFAAHSARELKRRVSDVQARANGTEITNQILLGAAGAAVAVAFGVALQRRSTEPVE